LRFVIASIYLDLLLVRLRAFGCGFEVFVGALEIFDFAALEMPDAGGDFIEDVFVVSDEKDCASYFQGDVERVVGFEARLLVGSSQHQEFASGSSALQKMSRAHSPPESRTWVFRASSPLKSILSEAARISSCGA